MPVPLPGAVVVDKPLRSGQQVYARGTDLVVLAMVSFGAEVIADGNIHAYAPLRGRAIAGARAATEARTSSAPAWLCARVHRRHIPHHRNRIARRRARQDRAGTPRR
ncbi:MAG: septum site-determining protein MinC [Paenacidovorax caeni]